MPAAERCRRQSAPPTEDPRRTAAERDAADAFTRLLLVQRNATMAERAEPLLQEGVFIAVGALNLPGKDGLIERFRRADYIVTKEW